VTPDRSRARRTRSGGVGWSCADAFGIAFQGREIPQNRIERDLLVDAPEAVEIGLGAPGEATRAITVVGRRVMDGGGELDQPLKEVPVVAWRHVQPVGLPGVVGGVIVPGVVDRDPGPEMGVHTPVLVVQPDGAFVLVQLPLCGGRRL